MEFIKFKYRLVIFCLCIAAPLVIHGQTHLAVELKHPVYTLIELAEIKGILPWLPQSKPYPFSILQAYLNTLTESVGFRQRFNIREQQLLLAFKKQFCFKGIDGANPLTEQKTYWSGFAYPGPGGIFCWGVNEESLFKFNFNQPDAWHMFNGIRLYLAGDLGSELSYYGNFGFTYDKVGPESFVPYSFTKQWDGYHINFGDKRYSYTGIEPYPNFSYILENEITGFLFEKQLLLRFARLRREWSTGEGSLYLSASARPFEGIDLQARLLPWFGIGFSLGSLGDWSREADLNRDPSDPDLATFQKMLTLQSLDFYPTDWLYFSVVSTALWGKRFEIGYMMPLMYPVIHQNLHGDLDNVAQSVNLAIRIPGYAKLFFSFYADEMEFTSLGELFRRPRNMLAFQAGMKAPLPFLPLSLFTFQYTKIEPFVYAHYTEDAVSALSHPVDLSYTHDGECLGYPLPPNSDEFLFKLEGLFRPEWLVSIDFRLIRHGTNDTALPSQKAIYGDINMPFNYDLRDEYPDKHFLHDGYYDWNTVFTCGLHFSPSAFPVAIGCDLSLVYTWWVMNRTGLPPHENKWSPIVGFSFRLFH